MNLKFSAHDAFSFHIRGTKLGYKSKEMIDNKEFSANKYHFIKVF